MSEEKNERITKKIIYIPKENLTLEEINKNHSLMMEIKENLIEDLRKDLEEIEKEKIRILNFLLSIDTENKLGVQDCMIKEKDNDSNLKQILDILQAILKNQTNSEKTINVAKEIMNIHEVAVYTGYSKQTIYQWKEFKNFPYHQEKPKGKLMFIKSEVDEWIKKNKKNN